MLLIVGFFGFGYLKILSCDKVNLSDHLDFLHQLFGAYNLPSNRFYFLGKTSQILVLVSHCLVLVNTICFVLYIQFDFNILKNIIDCH